MAKGIVNTVTGPISVDQLGPTLMHEHVMIGIPGWENDTIRPGPRRRDALAIGVDRIAELQARGVQSMLDPCPNDLGRDVELMSELSVRTGFQIICATGFYREGLGAAPYWHFRGGIGKLFAGGGNLVEDIAELMIHELTRGIGSTGVRAGIIKVGSGHDQISPYERTMFAAAVLASNATGAPITTHTEGGILGDQQQALLLEGGVPGHRIIIGHSCNSWSEDYHLGILERGSYLGFDQFGSHRLFPVQQIPQDEDKARALAALIGKGHANRIVISHDTVWCWRGEPIPLPRADLKQKMIEASRPIIVHDEIIPRLLAIGVNQADIDIMLIENPKRYFADIPPR